jgi:site-specific recombinase XerD
VPDAGNRLVRQYVDAALAANTVRAYRSDLHHFIAWGGTLPATEAQVAHYLAQHAATLAVSTLTRHLAAIAQAHRARGFPSPSESELVQATLRGIRRAHGRAVRQVAPLLKEQLIRMVRGLSGSRGLRDRALLLIGFAGALRRAELVALDVEDVCVTPDGILLHLRRSKTDPDGIGREIAIPWVQGRHCPGRALWDWLQIADITTGAIFRRVDPFDHVLPKRLTPQSVSLIIKQRGAAIGLDPSHYAGHSLRAGFVTSATAKGASPSSIRDQTGHKSDAMMQRYVRHAHRFAHNSNRVLW